MKSVLGELDEFAQELKADSLAFLGVKLGGENIVPPDGREAERAVIVRPRGQTIAGINRAAG